MFVTVTFVLFQVLQIWEASSNSVNMSKYITYSDINVLWEISDRQCSTRSYSTESKIDSDNKLSRGEWNGMFNTQGSHWAGKGQPDISQLPFLLFQQCFSYNDAERNQQPCSFTLTSFVSALIRNPPLIPYICFLCSHFHCDQTASRSRWITTTVNNSFGLIHSKEQLSQIMYTWYCDSDALFSCSWAFFVA